MPGLEDHDWSIGQREHTPIHYTKPQSLSYLVDHLRNRFLISPETQEYRKRIADKTFYSNEAFWERVLNSSRYWGFQNVVLDGFRIIDWFPRSPGLSFTLEAAQARKNAEKHLEDKSKNVYRPDGKEMAIRGGIGTYRFNPFDYQNRDYCLCTATSNEYCHTGIPLAVSVEQLQDLDFYALHKITGKYQPISASIAPYFTHLSHVPKFYFFVDEIVPIRVATFSLLLTPVVFMRGENGENLTSFCTVQFDDSQNLDLANIWLLEYAHRYHAEIITDYDQQRPAFSNVPFSLQNVMADEISITHLLQSGFSEREAIILKYWRPIMKINNKGSMNIIQGDNKGTAIASGSIQNSLNQVNPPNVPEEIKVLFKELRSQIEELCKQLSPDEAEIVKQDLEALSTEVLKDKPSKRIFEIKIESLKKAAENVAEVAIPILTIADKLLPFLLAKVK